MALLRRLGLSVSAFALMIGLWQGYIWIGHFPAYVVPGPWAVWKEIAYLWSVELPADFQVTLTEIGLGTLYGAVAGLAIGIAFAKNRTVENVFTPLVVLIQTAPKISLAPLIILWFGLGLGSKVILVAIAVFFPIMVQMVTAMRSVDARTLELLTLLRASSWRRLWSVELPWSLPAVFAGLRVGTTQAVTAVVIGELVGAKAGLGYLLSQGQNNADVKMVLASIVLLSALGFVMYVLVYALERKVLRWQETPGLGL